MEAMAASIMSALEIMPPFDIAYSIRLPQSACQGEDWLHTSRNWRKVSVAICSEPCERFLEPLNIFY
jgi:hypothetical protein